MRGTLQRAMIVYVAQDQFKNATIQKTRKMAVVRMLEGAMMVLILLISALRATEARGIKVGSAKVASAFPKPARSFFLVLVCSAWQDISGSKGKRTKKNLL